MLTLSMHTLGQFENVNFGALASDTGVAGTTLIFCKYLYTVLGVNNVSWYILIQYS